MTEVRTTSSTGGQKGVKLARFDLIPPGPLKELAEHYGRGARKYANHQWRQGYEWSKSIAALARHFNDFMAGKDYDVCSNDPTGCSFVDAEGEPFESGEPDTCFNHTGSHHMAAVAWHSFLLLEFKDVHPDHDDRYVVSNVLEADEPGILERLGIAPYQAAINDSMITQTPPWLYESVVIPPEYLELSARFVAGQHGTEDLHVDAVTVVWGDPEPRAIESVESALQMINDRLYNQQG